jgi:hypothetical protein
MIPMWIAMFLKYWKVFALGVVVLGIIVYVGTLRHQLKQERESVQLLSVKLKLCEMQADSLVGQIQSQNEAVSALQTLADARQKKLDELLSQPPRIIYRDRITDVPVILTGECETVMDALADYFERLTDVQ